MTTATTSTAARAGQGTTRARKAGSDAAQSATDSVVSTLVQRVFKEVAPQVAGEVLDAVARRASSSVDNLTGRLETVAAEGGLRQTGEVKAVLTGKTPSREPDQEEDESEKPSMSSRVRAGLGFVIQQAIQFLELVKQWARRLLAAAQRWLGRGAGAADSDREPAAEPSSSDDLDEDEPGEELADEFGNEPRAKNGSRNRSSARPRR
jgi:hypothetical protein